MGERGKQFCPGHAFYENNHTPTLDSSKYQYQYQKGLHQLNMPTGFRCYQALTCNTNGI